MYFDQRVASSTCPSLKWASTTSCCVALSRCREYFGQHFQPHDLRIVGLRPRHAAGDPFGQHAIFERARLQPHAAFVRQQARRLGQNQAAARIGRHDSPADGLPREIGVVGIDVEAEQRQPKAFLSGPRPVARAGVAALLREDRFDVIAKAPLKRLVHAA